MLTKKPRHRIIYCILILTLVLFAGCGGKAGSSGMYDPYGEQALPPSITGENTSYSEGLAWSGESYGEIATASTASAGAARAEPARQSGNQEAIQIESSSPLVARKLIKQANLRIEADSSYVDSEGNLSGVNQKVDEMIKRYGAYIESSKSDEDTARFTIRVPEVFYETLIAGISALGKTLSRTETAEDVTVKYYDLEGRLNTKKTLLGTFQGYLSRTTSIDDIMKVEARISELQNEIDWLGNQLTRLGNLVDYATVELTIFTSHYTPPRSETLGERINQLFSGFGAFASNVLVGILWIFIYLVPIIVICLVAYWLLFGKIGILKKAFRSATGNNTTRKKEEKNKSAAKEGEQ